MISEIKFWSEKNGNVLQQNNGSVGVTNNEKYNYIGVFFLKLYLAIAICVILFFSKGDIQAILPC